MFTLTSILVGIVILVAFIFIARRVFRLALKLTLIGGLILLLLAGGAYGWWQGWFGSTSRTEQPASQTRPRANSNRRPSR